MRQSDETTTATGSEQLSGVTVVGRGGGQVVVALEDRRLAQGLGDLRWRLGQLAPYGTESLEVDLSGVDRLSSGCIATLLWVKRACAARGIRVLVGRPTSRTREQLVRTGLADVLEIGSIGSIGSNVS